MRTDSRPVSRFDGLHIHFIGIGGCGMSGLARMLLDSGAIISGSDPRPNEQTNALACRGATISRNQDGSLLSPDIDIVVRTAAIPEWNPEYQRAKALGLRQLKYAQLLGLVMQERLGIAVSGTHGKTTTTSMISFALLECAADPSFVIGGTVPQLGGSSRSGRGDAFVVEACEFDRSFHNYHPRIAVITNIEADHLDCYPGGIGEIVDSFRIFAQLVPGNRLIIANGEDPRVARALSRLDTAIEWVGMDPRLTWYARVTSVEKGLYRADIHHRGAPVAQLRLAVAGQHNVFNATAAVAACYSAGVEPDRAAEAISRFTGADRRMSEVGKYNGATVVDDYGHHPTEIRTTLRAIREKFSPRRLVCVFQPHQFSRTRYLLDEFATSFQDADLTILPDIYAARDTDADKRAVDTAELVRRIKRNGQEAIYLAQFPTIVEYLRREVRPGDLILTMGAGNICDVGRELVSH